MAGTLVVLEDGQLSAIEQVRVGQSVAAGGKVRATMAFDRAAAAPLVELPGGVRLTSDHAVRAAGGAWTRAGRCPEARVSFARERDGPLVFDLITEKHRLVVAGSSGAPRTLCADYEETQDSAEDLARFVQILCEEDAATISVGNSSVQGSGGVYDGLGQHVGEGRACL